MEAFTKVLGTIGGDIGGITKGLSPIMSVFGMINQFSQAQKEKALSDRSIYYAKHPEAIANLAKSFEKPLDQGLIKGTENVVNASLGEQGLSQAPGIQSQVLAQALAPYQQNAQQMAITEALKAIGLPAEALAGLQSTMRPNDLAAMLKGILPQGDATGGGGGGGGGIVDSGGIVPAGEVPV